MARVIARLRRSTAGQLWSTSVGKKIAVAISGSILLGYVVLHMLGNLTSLYGDGGSGGDARVDGYSEWLREFGEPLLPHGTVVWGVRGLLLVAIVVHLTGIVQLRKRNAAARPQHHGAAPTGRSLSSRTMALSGSLLLAFIVFHILQFTTLTIEITPLHHGAVYANLAGAFQKWYLVAIYVVAIGLLALHLRHAVWSATQTLGLDRPGRNQAIRLAATAGVAVVTAGFASVPLAFWTGVLPQPTSHASEAHVR